MYCSYQYLIINIQDTDVILNILFIIGLHEVKKKILEHFVHQLKNACLLVLAEDSLLQKGYNSRRIRQLTTARLCRRESLWRHRINTSNASTHFKVSLSYHFSSHIPSSTKNKSKFPTDNNDDRRHIIELRRNGFFFFGGKCTVKH